MSFWWNLTSVIRAFVRICAAHLFRLGSCQCGPGIQFCRLGNRERNWTRSQKPTCGLRTLRVPCRHIRNRAAASALFSSWRLPNGLPAAATLSWGPLKFLRIFLPRLDRRSCREKNQSDMEPTRNGRLIVSLAKWAFPLTWAPVESTRMWVATRSHGLELRAKQLLSASATLKHSDLKVPKTPKLPRDILRH